MRNVKGMCREAIVLGTSYSLKKGRTFELDYVMSL